MSDAQTSRQTRAAANGLDPPSAPVRYTASIFPGDRTGPENELPEEFIELVQALETALGTTVWMLVQRDSRPLSLIDGELFERFFHDRGQFEGSKPVAVLIDSPGGDSKSAYRLAMLFRNSCGGFVAVIPRYAKSAATLLTLGADKIFLGRFAELGPLDALLEGADGRLVSALDEVSSLERLHAVALEFVQSTASYLAVSDPAFRKRPETAAQMAFGFAAEMMRPLLENIDAVRYTQRSRILRVAEQYAVRLMAPLLGGDRDKALKIASALVLRYPDHEFAIDLEEANYLGLNVARRDPSNAVFDILDRLRPLIKEVTAIGRLRPRLEQ
jgi:hypothetical protein